MSVGLRLLAKLDRASSEPEPLLKRIARWIGHRYAVLSPTIRHGFIEVSPAIFCRLHPAAEEVEIWVPDSAHLAVSANTSTVGPGYHIFLCELLREFAEEFSAVWQEESDDYLDEAEYFFTGDQQKVFDNMTEWLQAVAGSFFDGTLESMDRTALCMPIGISYEADDFAITPLGPRSREWLYETSKDGESGKDLFAWWKPGLSAEFFLGRALAQMWTEVRWRPPINQSETTLLNSVAHGLLTAYKLDPALEFPWSEWREILELLGESSTETAFVRARHQSMPAVGYRRRNVTVDLPGHWGIRIPGAFSEFEPDGEGDLYALDPPREIWFTSYRFTTPSPFEDFTTMKNRMIKDKPEYFREAEGYVSKAHIEEKIRENGKRYFVLGSSNRCPSQRAVCTILFSEPHEKDWALEVWRSIRPPSRPDIGDGTA